MAAPDLELGEGEVLITQGNSGLGLFSPDNRTSFGTVVLVNDLSDRIQVGDSVMYDPSKSKRLIYGSTLYELIREEFVSGKEVITP